MAPTSPAQANVIAVGVTLGQPVQQDPDVDVLRRGGVQVAGEDHLAEPPDRIRLTAVATARSQSGAGRLPSCQRTSDGGVSGRAGQRRVGRVADRW